MSFVDVSGPISPEEGGADRYPDSLHPVSLQPERAAKLGQPGSTGSPRLLHAPKKSTLRPRGSKAQHPELAPSTDLSARSAMSAGISEGSRATAASEKRKGAGFADMPGEESASFRTDAAPHEVCESPLEGSPVRRTVLKGRGSNDYIRSKPAQDPPATPKSSTALQAKLQRLKAKWSVLAGRGHAPSDSRDTLKPARAVGDASTQGGIAVSVTASAPSFTVTELDTEESLAIESKRDALNDPVAADGVEADTSYYRAAAESDPAGDVSMHDNAESQPARSAWEEALGLPAGAYLWGPTVLELPDYDSTAGLSESLPSDQSDSTLQTDSRRVYLTALRPVAEALETESFEQSSHLSSPTTVTTIITEMRSPDSDAETYSTLNVQGNSLFEDLTRGMTSPTLTTSTLTLETASASVAEGPEHLLLSADAEEPKQASLLMLKPDKVQGSVIAVPADAHERRLTLDQRLSVERVSPLDGAAGSSHPQALQQQSSSPAADMLEQKHCKAALGATQDPDSAEAAAPAAGGDIRGRTKPYNGTLPTSSAEDDARAEDSNQRELAGKACTLCEPAALDRGEPTLEESLRSQETKNTGRRVVQLLQPGKQLQTRQPAHSSRSPQRSFSPFGRLGCMPRAASDQAPGFIKDLMAMPSSMQCESCHDEPKQVAEPANGPGPLEKGMHEVELGGYYLTTPDPLRTDPGFAPRQRTSSEQSGQSAAQQRQHARDPLNSDPVHYVSSPAWRMNNTTALNKLQPGTEPATASDSEASREIIEKGPSPAPIRHVQKQRRYGYTEDKHEIQDSTQPGRRPRDDRDDPEGRASRQCEQVPAGFARAQVRERREDKSRTHAKEQKSRVGSGTEYVLRSVAVKSGADRRCTSTSEVSTQYPAYICITVSLRSHCE